MVLSRKIHTFAVGLFKKNDTMSKLRNMVLAWLMATTTVAMADDYAYLTIDEEGSETSFAISEISKITFDETNMLLTLTNGATQKLPLQGLSKMFFSANGQSAIHPVMASQARIRLSGGVIHVEAEPGSVVTLYNISGQSVQTVTATGGDTQLNVSGMRKGVYIVKVGNETKKIMNR